MKKKSCRIVLVRFCAEIFGCQKPMLFKPAVSMPAVTTTEKAHYVSDLLGADANNGVTISTPLKKISAAYDKAVGCNTVFIMKLLMASPIPGIPEMARLFQRSVTKARVHCV